MAFRDLSEHERARHWREACGMTRQELSELTGYSLRQIVLFEKGETNTGDPIAPEAWKRYRLICAAVMAGLDFDWRRVKCGDVIIRAEEWRGDD
jgi:transcriptional regulator with XRE-family HTH domain